MGQLERFAAAMYAAGAESMKADELSLSAETVQCFLYALLDEAKRRGGMFPQTSDEQDDDTKAVRRVCDMVNWYGKQGEPNRSAVLALHTIRASNRLPITPTNTEGEQG